MRMNLLGILPFTAPYLAWVLLTLSALLGSPLETDLVSFEYIYIFFFVIVDFGVLATSHFDVDPPKYCTTSVRSTIVCMHVAHSEVHPQSECHHYEYGKAVW